MMIYEEQIRKFEEIIRTVDSLRDLIVESVREGREAHEVEELLFRSVLKLAAQFMEAFFEMVGAGDVGETVELPDGRIVKRLDPQPRTYRSVFGDFQITRFVYAVRQGQKIELEPTDQQLGLPESDFSYLLQEWGQLLGVEHAWGKVMELLQHILGIPVCVDSLERTNRKMAEIVEPFREQLSPPDPEEEGEILVATVDNKGVPIRRPAEGPPPGARRKKGEKANKKRHATLGGVYSVDRKQRTPEDVVAALFRERPRRRRREAVDPQARQKRFRATLSDPERNINGQTETFLWLAEEVACRRRRGQPLVYLTDGQRSLQTDRMLHLDQPDVVEIIDLLHVVPRLWEAAYLFHPEGSRQAQAFVRPRLLRILQGDARGVITGLRRMGTTHKLRAAKRKTLRTICLFLEKNLPRMHYDQYLAAGYPIATGVIEGACRHVIKDRLERAGMRWIVAGAQAMLDLRTTWINGHWHKFQTFRINRERQRLYPHRKAFKKTCFPLTI